MFVLQMLNSEFTELGTKQPQITMAVMESLLKAHNANYFSSLR